MPDQIYSEPIAGDFRQGDIFRDTLSLWLADPDPPALRPRTGKGGLTNYSPHSMASPPPGGFRWQDREYVLAEAKMALAIVLTHDCEIENDENERYRQVALIRPLMGVPDPDDRQVIVEGRNLGRLYLPAQDRIGLPESYVDFRAITTLRRAALHTDRRIAGLSDYGRTVLQAAIIGYFTELSDRR